MGVKNKFLGLENGTLNLGQTALLSEFISFKF